LASSFLPALFRVSLIVLVLPAGIVTVMETIVIVFLVVFFFVLFLVDAATAITLPPRIVSSTVPVSLILQEVVPLQRTCTLIVVPEVVMCLTLARPLTVGGGFLTVTGGGVVAVIGVEWPVLARWVLSPV
jgi:hypothetical protein